VFLFDSKFAAAAFKADFFSTVATVAVVELVSLLETLAVVFAVVFVVVVVVLNSYPYEADEYCLKNGNQFLDLCHLLGVVVFLVFLHIPLALATMLCERV
jgi:hypothetical protein